MKRFRLVAYEEQTTEKACIQAEGNILKLKACAPNTKAQEFTRIYGNGLKNLGPDAVAGAPGGGGCIDAANPNTNGENAKPILYQCMKVNRNQEVHFTNTSMLYLRFPS